MKSDAPERTLLVVDDEQDIRLILEDILSLRYRVLLAVDGIDALERIAAHADIELVLTDLRMPRMDGMELVEKVRTQHAHLGLMMISAHGNVREAVEALKSGVFDYITKPLPADFKEIYAKIDRYFQMRALREEQEKLQRQILYLSCFPRSNPNYIARARLANGDVRLLPGNERTAELLGRAAAEKAGADGGFSYLQGRVRELFPGDFPEQLQRIVGTDEVVEIDRVRSGQVYYHHTYTPFVDNREELFVNISDITRRVENEQLRTMLEAGMEHEFKNHLMSIAPNAEMLRTGLLGQVNDQQREALDLIIDGGNQLLESLTQRLEFSRAYSGTLQLRRTHLDLYDLTRQVYDTFLGRRPECTFKVAGLPYERGCTKPRGISAFCDPQYLRRVFNNLVGNAIKHASWVDVHIEDRGHEILCQVVDGGDGMDEEDCQGIWNLGYRAKNRRGRSTGIGLPYSKLVVEAHGGCIGVRSQPGKGSTFHFTLPGKE